MITETEYLDNMGEMRVIIIKNYRNLENYQ